MHRSPSACSVQRRVSQHARNTDAYAWFNLLTGSEMFDEVESLLPRHRERLFPPTETLSMFLSQALSADRSCQNAVNQAALRRMAEGLPHCSTNTGAYCRARARLPLEMVRTLAHHSARQVGTHATQPWRWRGRPVRLVDGTTVLLPDTQPNQDVYPQPDTQKAGLGFPICRLVGVVCLGSGALLDAASGRYQGKGGDEQSLLRSILDCLQRGDVLVGDAYYATYFLLCALCERGIDAVFEQYGARRRSTDFRRGQRLGSRDHLIVWDKPTDKPQWMSRLDYERAPDTLTVRELRVGGKTLVTTLLCPKQTDKNALKALFAKRWHVELDLRNIKTTLGMERLSCLTPQMAIKEIWVYVLAYNLIRLMMAHAALLTEQLPRQLSFKHTVQLSMAWTHQAPALDDHDQFQDLLVLVAQQRVGNRPGRIEPRALKRRPRSYPLLTTPRAAARAKIRKCGHSKNVK